jgi:hypothetical protein
MRVFSNIYIYLAEFFCWSVREFQIVVPAYFSTHLYATLKDKILGSECQESFLEFNVPFILDIVNSFRFVIVIPK